MSSLQFTRAELSAAMARGVRQCVVIGSRLTLREAVTNVGDEALELFAVDEERASEWTATFVQTRFGSETLAAALGKSSFDRLKASLFIWIGGAGYRTVDAAVASLAFIASLPSGSGVVLDYAEERSSAGSLTQTALDALASRMLVAGGSVKHLIQPQAVMAMLRGLGFQQIVDLAADEEAAFGGHLVSAVV